jgi:hypothetical protein
MEFSPGIEKILVAGKKKFERKVFLSKIQGLLCID